MKGKKQEKKKEKKNKAYDNTVVHKNTNTKDNKRNIQKCYWTYFTKPITIQHT